MGPKPRGGGTKYALLISGAGDAAVLADDIVNDFEKLLGRRDRAADALDRLADEAGNLARRFVLNHVLDVVRALDTARRIFEPERTAVTIAGQRVAHVRAVVGFEFPG